MPINGFKNFKQCENTIKRDLKKRKNMSDEKASAAANRICGAKEKETQNSKFNDEDLKTIGEYVVEMSEFNNGIFPSGNYNFSLLGHFMGDKISYDLQIQTDKGVRALTFMSENPIEVKKIETLNEAREVTCKCKKQIGNTPGISRLHSEFSIPEERTEQWMNFEGVTKHPENQDGNKGVYVKIGEGEVEVDSNSSQKAIMKFNSENMDGRWVLQEIDNIFEDIEGDKAFLFWKPETKESLMEAKRVSTLKLETLQDQKLVTLNSAFDSKLEKKKNSNEFKTVMMAEGKWIDRFGQVFLYNRDFIELAHEKLTQLGELPVDKHHTRKDNGKMTKFNLKKYPVYHIEAEGYYNGDISDVKGSSIDAVVSAVGDATVGAIPVDVDFKRNSLVSKPACKICLNF